MALDQYESDARLAQVTSVTDTDTRQALIASKSLQNRLDQVSEMALGELEQSAIQRGELYGVENSPTKEQITRAIQQDQDVNALFAKEGTVFGNSARKVQAELFRQESIADFLNKAEITKTGIKDKVISATEADSIATNLQADVDATYEILKQIDPKSAVKFNAQASKIGYGVVSAAKLQVAKIELERKQAQATLFNDNYLSEFKAEFFENGDIIKATILTKDIRNDVIGVNNELGDPKANLKLWNKENEIIQDYIVAKIAEDNTVMQFMDGTDTTFDNLLEVRGLRGSKEDIVKKVIAKEKEMNDLTEALDKQKTKANEEAVDINETDYFGDNTEGLTPKEFIDKQRPLGKFYSSAQKEKIFKQPSEGEASGTQVTIFQNTLDQITIGRVGIKEIEDLENSGEINGKQYSKLREAYRKQDNYKVGNAIIKRRMGVVGNDLNINKKIKIPLGKALETFAEKVRELEEQGLPVDQVTIANDLIGGELKGLYKEIFDKDKATVENLTKGKINNVLPNDSIYKNITVDEILDMTDAQLDNLIEEVLKEEPTALFNGYKNRLRDLRSLNNDY